MMKIKLERWMRVVVAVSAIYCSLFGAKIELVRSQEKSLFVTPSDELVKHSHNLSPKSEMLAQNPEADRLWEEGWQLYDRGTAAAWEQAIEKWEAARQLYQTAEMPAEEARTLNQIGQIYNNLGEQQTALDYYDRALSLWRKTEDRAGEAATLNNIGLVYNDFGENNRSLEYYHLALPLWQQAGDREGESITISNIGAVYADLGDWQKALDYYNQALLIQQNTGDRSGEASTLNNIGNVYSDLGDKQTALDYLNRSVIALRALGDRRREATTLSNIGAVYDDLGEKQQALDYYNQALPIQREVGDRSGVAVTLNNLGNVYSDLGENQQALDYYSQATPLWREMGDRYREAITLNNLGAVYSDLGEKQQALDYYNQALSLRREVGDRSGEAVTLNNIGQVYDSLGEKQQALDYYNQALPLRREVGDRSGEAITLSSIGRVYDDLGNKQQALDYYNQALPLSRAASDRDGEAVTLNNIGAVYDDLEDKQKALDYYNQALILRREIGDRAGEAITLSNIGGVYSDWGEKQKALDYYNQALPLRREVGDRAGEAITLNNIGLVYADLGDKQKALDYYHQALPLSQAVGDRSSTAMLFFNLAYIYRDSNNLPEALIQIDEALTIVEDLRTKIGSEDLRASYFATVQDYYQLKIDLLMQLHQQQPDKGYNKTALETNERARARTLLELLNEANADIRTGVNPQLLERETQLRQQLDSLESQRLQGNPSAAVLVKLDRDSDALLGQLQQLIGQIRATSPAYADLEYPQPLTLPEIQQQVIDEETVLLQYALGKTRSYLWVVTPTSMSSYELPAAAEITDAVANFRRAITYPTLRHDRTAIDRAAAPLTQLLLAPAIEQLGEQLENKRLLIVADGALQYLPFAALPVGTENAPLIAQHEIINLPSASALGILRKTTGNRTPAPKQVAILADPVFGGPDDERLSMGGDRSADAALQSSARDIDLALPPRRLLFTREEAGSIAALFPASERLEALDFEASRQLATSDTLSQYRIVHFATHGFLNSVNPELSGLILSLLDEHGKPDRGFLRLHDIFNLNLPAELVVLSACQTGLGEEVRGEGLVGLTRGFMYAGAKRVAVSLWSVDDKGTAVLMTEFYRQMLAEQLSPAAALRQAQLTLLQQEEWRSPYYWAAFTMQGEWRE